jgi:hypothetical protein
MTKGGSLDSSSSCDSGTLRPSSMDTLIDKMRSRSGFTIGSSASHSSSQVWEMSDTARRDEQRSPCGQQAWSYMPRKGFHMDDHQEWAERRGSSSGYDGEVRANSRPHLHRSGSEEFLERCMWQNRSSSPSLRKRLHLLGLRDEFNRFLSKQSECAVRASRDRPMRSANARYKAPREETSIFAREPAFHKHVCLFYLFLLILVLVRMASEPSEVVSGRLERARRVAEERSLKTM